MNFWLTIDKCVVTDIALRTRADDKSYYLGYSDTLEWQYDDTFATLTPLCGYPLEFSYINMPAFAVTTSTGEVSAQTYDRSYTGTQTVSVVATVTALELNPEQISISDSFIFDVIDPCPETILDILEVPDMVAY